MKKLGLIGGIGPESTLLYYRKLVYAAHERVGEHFFPSLTIILPTSSGESATDVLPIADYTGRLTLNLAGFSLVGWPHNASPYSISNACGGPW